MLDEVTISRGIIEAYTQKLLKGLDVDVAVVGAGPSGIVCAYFLAKAGKDVVLFEKKLSIGGGMWGGGMMFNEIVVQQEAKGILDLFGIRAKAYQNDYYLADAIKCVCAFGYQAVAAGAIILNGIMVDDVMVKQKRICWLVVEWSAVESAGLHVDPLTIKAKAVVDASGHPCEVVRVVERKSGVKLNTATGKILGEKSMWAEVAERRF
jgi:sulfide-dependent adenosine diphosphate thiazole synthase